MTLDPRLNKSANSIIETAETLKGLDSDASGDSLFGKVLNGVFDVTTSILNKGADFLEKSIVGAAGFLTDLVQKVGGTVTVKELADSIVDKNKKKFDEPDPKDPEGKTPREQYEEALIEDDKEEASIIIAPYTSKDRNELKSIHELTTATKAGTVIVDASSLSLPASFNIGSTFGSENPDFFSYVTSREELEAEMRAIHRPISEVIVHWTETHTNSNMGADQIRDMAIALGANKMPYHYVIKRDGSLQRGYPVSTATTHTELLDHDKYSISIVFVGGLNVATGAPDADEFSQAGSLTRSQFNTFNEFVRIFYDVYPGGQVLGHRDIDISQEDPGFDVIEYCETMFNKYSLYSNPITEQALSPKDIINRQNEISLEIQSLSKK